MNDSIRSSALAARLLAGVAVFAAPAAWAQPAPKPADAPEVAVAKRYDRLPGRSRPRPTQSRPC